jgi:nucleoside-diphosphate-sugar epimerase
MKLLLMGAGYVGMALLQFLQNDNYEISVTTTNPQKAPLLSDYAKEVLLLDPESDESLQNLIETCDAMILTIAPNGTKTYEETYLNTAKTISRCLQGRSKPFYIIYTSSTSVYEGIDSEWATEDLILKPFSDNGKILLETEDVLLKCADTCILRLGGIHGRNREISKRAAYFSGKEFPGTGTEPTNHSHLDDIVAAIVYFLKHHLTGIYNVVSDEHPTRDELYSKLCQKLSYLDQSGTQNFPTQKKTTKSLIKKSKRRGFFFCLRSCYRLKLLCCRIVSEYLCRGDHKEPSV